MTASVRPTYQAIVDQALAVTQARSGWLLRATDAGLVVAATAGLAMERDDAEVAIGAVIEPTGAKGYVLASGQPVALIPPPGDVANESAAGFPGVPSSVLAAPCGDDSVIGLIELAESENDQPFTLDDIDAVGSLAVIAGAAMAEDDDTRLDVASPAEIASELERLAGQDPARYSATARLIESVLGQGA